MVDSVSSGGTTQSFTAEELIERAKKAVETKQSTAGMSAVQKMLAEHGDTDESDTVQLSPVAKMLAAKNAEKTKTSTPYTEQDWYISAKVNQLRGQLALYSTLPGLDPGGNIMNGIEKEIKDILKKQQDTLAKTQADAAAKQEELAKQQAAAYQGASSDQMLANAKNAANGVKAEAPLSDAAKALLDKIKGGTVNTTA
jgi:hypothetical protein